MQFSDLTMEALYHQTNGLLSQTQGYYVRLEQVDGYITIFVSQNWLNWSPQGSPGDDLERLEVEVKSLNLIIIMYIQYSAHISSHPTIDGPPSNLHR